MIEKRTSFQNLFVERLSQMMYRREGIANWKEARKTWLHESKVIELADVLVYVLYDQEDTGGKFSK
jgi:hypothetical protein